MEGVKSGGLEGRQIPLGFLLTVCYNRRGFGPREAWGPIWVIFGERRETSWNGTGPKDQTTIARRRDREASFNLFNPTSGHLFV